MKNYILDKVAFKQSSILKFLWKLANQFEMTNHSKFLKFEKFKYQSTHSNEIFEIQKFYHSMGGGNPYFQYSKLLEIFEILKEKKPLNVIEYGTGSSSHVFNKFHEIETLYIEENLNWWESVSKNLDIKTFRIPKKIKNGINFSYDYRVDKKYDLVYIDGPHLWFDDVDYSRSAICFDIFNFEEKFLPDTIVVDMRLNTVDEIEKRFKNKYKLKRSDILNRNPKRDFQYHSIFEKIT